MQRKATVFYAGGQSRYNFSFPYLSKQFVKVRYDRATSAQQLEYNRDYTIEGQTVTLLKAAPSDVTVCIYRQTPTERLVDFNDGSLLLASEMDKMSTQLLHVEEESSDLIASSAMVADDDNAWQGRGRRIKNLHDPIERQDAVTLNHLDQVGVARQEELQRIEQAVRADKESALSFKNDAASSAQSAASSASSSAQYAAASEVSRQASAESEANITNMQTNVRAMETHIQSKRDHVDSVKIAVDTANAQVQNAKQSALTEADKARMSAVESAQSAAEASESMKKAQQAAKLEGVVQSANIADGAVIPSKIGFAAKDIDVYTKGEMDTRLNTKAPLASPALTGTPTVPTAAHGTNTAQIASTAFVAQAIAALVSSSPDALDTLQELAAALGNDANFATTITNALAGKVSKSGDTMTGTLRFINNLGIVLYGMMADNDFWRVLAGNNGSNEGYLEIATADDGTEPILFRQYTGEFQHIVRTLELLNRDGNSVFPGQVWASEFHGKADSARQADNASSLEGHSLAQIQAMATKVAVLSGTIAHGATIPLPEGYTEEQCKWMVSMTYPWTEGKAQKGYVSCYTEGRIVRCAYHWYNDHSKSWMFNGGVNANYIVIGVK